MSSNGESLTNKSLPEIIDIELTLRASKPLGSGRKTWAPIEFRFEWDKGLVYFKGLIENKVKGIVQSYTENGHLIYYHTNGNNSDRMKVQLWTHQDDLYMKPKSDCPQKSYETVTSENFGQLLQSFWNNSYKGKGKGSRANIQEEYERDLLLSQNNPDVEIPDPPVLCLFKFIVYLEPIVAVQSQHRATQDRMERAGDLLQIELDNGTFDVNDTSLFLGQGERAYTTENYARTPMIDPPRRLINPTARQFARLDQFEREHQERFDQLYAGGGSWIKIKVMLLGSVVELPVDIASLRSALGLPHTDLTLFSDGGAQIERPDIDLNSIPNMEDVDHNSENDMAG